MLAGLNNASRPIKYFIIIRADCSIIFSYCGVGFVDPLSVMFELSTIDMTTNNTDRTIVKIAMILEKKSLSSSAFWSAIFTYLFVLTLRPSQ